MSPGVVAVVLVVVFLTDNNTTPTKVVLSCFGLLVGLWQFNLFLVSLEPPSVVGGWSKVTLVFWFGPNTTLCSFDFDLNQAEQLRILYITVYSIYFTFYHNPLLMRDMVNKKQFISSSPYQIYKINKVRILSQKFLAAKQDLHSVISLTD